MILPGLIASTKALTAPLDPPIEDGHVKWAHLPLTLRQTFQSLPGTNMGLSQVTHGSVRPDASRDRM